MRREWCLVDHDKVRKHSVERYQKRVRKHENSMVFAHVSANLGKCSINRVWKARTLVGMIQRFKFKGRILIDRVGPSVDRAKSISTCWIIGGVRWDVANTYWGWRGIHGWSSLSINRRRAYSGYYGIFRLIKSDARSTELWQTRILRHF